MALKQTLNWLNSRSTHSWTLGELVLSAATKKTEPKGMFTDHMTRSARFTERLVTIGAAVALGVAGAMSGSAFAVAGCLIAAKLAGVLSGKAVGAAIEKADHKLTPPAPDARDYRGYTQLGRAVLKGDAAKVKKLLEQGADTEATIPSGYGSETVAEAAVHSTPEIKKLFEDVATKKAAVETAPVVPAAKPAETPKPQP